MAHTFKLVFQSYPYNLVNLSIKLATELNIHLNRIAIGVDTINMDINSLSVDPFLDEYCGLQFTYRFNDNDPYTDRVFAEDYGFIEQDFNYSQQVLFSYNTFWKENLNSQYLEPLFRIISALQKNKLKNSMLLYTGPEKVEIIYTKIDGVISVNNSCSNLFDDQLLKMTKKYIVSGL